MRQERRNMTMDRMWRKRVEDAGILGEVSGGAVVEDSLSIE
jgi:hypothetical protein